ncbi:hypothetical protein [Meiothermus phage MMP17]|nr:hypothetical protein [Meiothermus phage MMP17]
MAARVGGRTTTLAPAASRAYTSLCSAFSFSMSFASSAISTLAQHFLQGLLAAKLDPENVQVDFHGEPIRALAVGLLHLFDPASPQLVGHGGSALLGVAHGDVKRFLHVAVPEGVQ